MVNLSLFMKWRWRLLNREDPSLWKEVLAAKYGDHILRNVVWSTIPNPRFASTWWKDIGDLEACVDSKNWVAEALSCRVGNGARTSVWCDKWLQDSALYLRFPRLFSLSNQKEAMISELVVFEGDRKVWNFSWRRGLFHWVEESVCLLVNSLAHVRNFMYLVKYLNQINSFLLTNFYLYF
jgi:hypothetical protein